MLLVQKVVRSWPAMMLGRLIEWTPRWARWSIAAVAVVMPVLAFTHGYELKKEVKAAWSRREVRRAKALLENEITAQEGVNVLVNALLRSPDEPDVIRSLAQVTDEAGLPMHARFFYEHLARRNAMTPEDKLRHAAVLARLHDHAGAQVALNKIQEMKGETTEVLRTRAEIALGKGDHAAARAALSKVLLQAPQDSQVALQRANAQVLSGESAEQHAGIGQMLDLFEQSLTQRDPGQRAQCFWMLSSMEIHDLDQRERFASLISRMPWKKLERQVMQRLLEASLDTTEREGAKLRDWLREMFVREAGTEAEERLAIAKMLQRQGLHYLVLEWITFEMGLRESGLCAARLDSLNAVKLWAESSAMIEHAECPLPHALKAIMRAYLELAAHGGKTLKGGELLREALTAADKRDNQGAFVAVGRLAAQFEHHDIALSAYGRALEPRFPVALFLADAFLAEARRAGGSAEIVLKPFSRRLNEEAWNQDLMRQVRYYRILCGENIELIEAEVQALMKEQPQDAYHAFLLAFARLRLGKVQELGACLPLLSQPRAWTAGERAVLHAIFLAGGDEAAAASLRLGIPAGTAFFTEESRLLAGSR